MKLRSRFRFVSILALVFATACYLAPRAPAAEAAAPAPKVRPPAVAGLFYPKDRNELAQLVDACLDAAKNEPLEGQLKALVCPHAGYSYSGLVAANAYRLLIGRTYDTVVVLGPSHTAALRAASVSDAQVFRTPLGDVPISPKARALAQLSPFALEPRAAVQRPDWWQQSSRPPPNPGEDSADTWEHSDEVQVPFLQRTLSRFQLLPVVVGDVDPAQAAKSLLTILDDRTLLIASSDLSHYDTYANAQTRDRRCVDAICALAADRIAPEDACGALPIRILIQIAKQKGWKTRLLDYRNSGDISGDKTKGVVGYAAIAFYAPAVAAAESPAPAPTPVPAPAYTVKERRLLMDLARKTVRAASSAGKLPTVNPATLAAKFTEKKGCFVTLTKSGELRGCIGHIVAQEPLWQAVVDNARNAAVSDPRFPPVTAREASQLEIEISVLTAPQPLAFNSPDDLLNKLQPRRDGVVLQIGDRSATYLPQVWDQIPDKVAFLDTLAEKAGCARSAWRAAGTQVSTYRVESFKESEL